MKPRVLMVAYACNPEGGGEHWLGWGWAEQAARDYEVELITSTNNSAPIDKRARECGITPHFVPLPEWFKRATTHVGKGGDWLRKIVWQHGAARKARELHRKSPFALVHQTTFHTFRVPFRAQCLGIPSVWGPIAGGEHVPPGFSRYLGSASLYESSRKIINRLWLLNPAVRRSFRKASAIFVSNRTTADFLPAEIRGKCLIVPPNALRPEDEDLPDAHRDRSGDSDFRLIYVGNCVATRAMPLVFEALGKSGLKNCRLTIIGDGAALEDWKKSAAALGVNGQVEFKGRVPFAQLPEHYAQADALVFPALRDSGGSALLEAMSRGLPVICLDWAGPGEMVDDQSGIKISVKSPEQAVSELAAAFVRLQREPALGRSLAAAARLRARMLFRWEAKHALLRATYEKLIHPR